MKTDLTETAGATPLPVEMRDTSASSLSIHDPQRFLLLQVKFNPAFLRSHPVQSAPLPLGRHSTPPAMRMHCHLRPTLLATTLLSALACAPTRGTVSTTPAPTMGVAASADTLPVSVRWFRAAGTAPSPLPPLRVLMWVGDNIQDFPRLRQDVRTASDSAFASFGDRFIVLPNPMYGSWERNPLP